MTTAAVTCKPTGDRRTSAARDEGVKEGPSAARGRRLLETWVEQLPGMSPRARRLLLEGDTEGRYRGHNDADAGFRLTMALAVAVSQPGRAWTPNLLYEAPLVLRPTAGGAWARLLQACRGDRYTLAELAHMLAKAGRFVNTSDSIECRSDAMTALVRIRQAVEQHQGTGRSGGTDEKNLTARLRLCERSGGADHAVSVRQPAELTGCAKSTAEASNHRLQEAGWLRLIESGSGKESSSQWLLRLPPLGTIAESSDDAVPGQLPSAGEGGQEVSRKRAGSALTPAP